MTRPHVTTKMHHPNLVRGEAQDELVARVGAEDAPLGCDGEGRLLVRVVLDAVRAVGLSGQQGLQVGHGDLPVEGQLHVPEGSIDRGPRSGPFCPDPVLSPLPGLAWPSGTRKWPAQPLGPSHGGASGRDSTRVSQGVQAGDHLREAPLPSHSSWRLGPPCLGKRRTWSHAPTTQLQGSGHGELRTLRAQESVLQGLLPWERCRIGPRPTLRLSSYSLPGPLWPEGSVPTGCQQEL